MEVESKRRDRHDIVACMHLFLFIDISFSEICRSLQFDLFSMESQFDIRNTADPGGQLMKGKQVDVGIYRIQFTVYKTGNIRVCFVNRTTGEERTLKVRNPWALQKKLNSVNYRI